MIDIYTDSSYKDGITGWAYVIKRGDEIISVASGLVKGLPDINHAEAYAIKMGVLGYLLYRPSNEGILIWCDNIGVCNMLMRKDRNYNKFDGFRDTIYYLLDSNGISYYINYLPRRSNKLAIKVDNLAKQELK